MFATRLASHDDTPVEDHIVCLSDTTWSDYLRLLDARGDRPGPRMAYADGVLELMSPSRSHEAIKSLIGCLVEVWCLERDVEFDTFGSWTLKDEVTQRGLEPDECYVFGGAADPARPDLAIEVVWTSGGINKRDIYRALGVREVWFWQRGRIRLHVLRGEAYVEVERSEVLPGIDVGELTAFLDKPSTSEAIRAYRATLSAAGSK